MQRKPVRLIKAGEMREHYSMKSAIDAMETAFSSLSSGESFVPQRYITSLPSGELTTLVKPAYVEAEKKMSVKILSQRDSDAVFPGIPLIQGVVLLLDATSGEILSIMDGEYLTALRTGAASGLATRLFARKDARNMALFGCGAQGKTQLEAVLCERDIRRILVYDKDKERADAFIREEHERYHVEMIYAESVAELADVDVICTATNATSALFKREDVKKGVHVNAVGSFRPDMQELDPWLLKDAKIYLDTAAACLEESGDLTRAIGSGVIRKDDVMGEIGDFCLGKIEGRESKKEITVFKSVGVAIQDFMVASDIYNAAIIKHFGQDFSLFE